jgi:hypothetical protein
VSQGVRTEWHLAELTDSEPDPFSEVVHSVGLKINLNASEDELAQVWARLLKREGRLYRNGLTCELKQDRGMDCLRCPQAKMDPVEPISTLCRLGKDQSTIERRVNELAAARRAPLEELAREVDEVSEIGHLDDELAELLTAVGL